MATFSFAAHNRFVTSSSTCESWPGIRFLAEDRRGSIPGASVRKLRIRARHIRPKTRDAMNTTSIAVLKFSVEVITLPESDVARALRF